MCFKILTLRRPEKSFDPSPPWKMFYFLPHFLCGFSPFFPHFCPVFIVFTSFETLERATFLKYPFLIPAYHFDYYVCNVCKTCHPLVYQFSLHCAHLQRRTWWRAALWNSNRTRSASTNRKTPRLHNSNTLSWKTVPINWHWIFGMLCYTNHLPSTIFLKFCRHFTY